MAWMTPVVGPEATFRWSIRIGAVVLGPLSLLILFILALKPDPVPDFLANVSLAQFGRGGALFAFELVVKERVCWLAIHYQNRFAKRAVVTVAVQPSQNFLMSRNEMPSLTVETPCGPAAYGIVSVPMPILQQYQGKKQSFDVGASIQYPDGTGELLRNRVGRPISSADIPGFGSLISTVARVAVSGTPPLAVKSPTRVQLSLPTDVKEFADQLPDMEHEEKWVLPPGFDNNVVVANGVE